MEEEEVEGREDAAALGWPAAAITSTEGKEYGGGASGAIPVRHDISIRRNVHVIL